MNVLILVMSARRSPWDSLMDTQMETWDSEEHPQTQTLYYVGKKCDLRPYDPRVFYSPLLSEDLGDVAARTIEAFEKSLDIEWQYMARVHSSTYVHKRNLVKFCHALPNHQVVCGVETEGEDPFIWGGCHYIFSRDVIFQFVDNKSRWNTLVMEDHSISEMVKYLGLKVTGGHSATINMHDDGTYTCFVYGRGENFVFKDFSEINKAQPHFLFRVKQDLHRHRDIEIFRELKEHYP